MGMGRAAMAFFCGVMMRACQLAAARVQGGRTSVYGADAVALHTIKAFEQAFQELAEEYRK